MKNPVAGEPEVSMIRIKEVLTNKLSVPLMDSVLYDANHPVTLSRYRPSKSDIDMIKAFIESEKTFEKPSNPAKFAGSEYDNQTKLQKWSGRRQLVQTASPNESAGSKGTSSERKEWDRRISRSSSFCTSDIIRNPSGALIRRCNQTTHL